MVLRQREGEDISVKNFHGLDCTEAVIIRGRAGFQICLIAIYGFTWLMDGTRREPDEIGFWYGKFSITFVIIPMGNIVDLVVQRTQALIHLQIDAVVEIIVDSVLFGYWFKGILDMGHL